jgi:ABC-type transport system involved in cytochrome bd biosynthesis fused ATPase/permease subunit
MPSTSKKQFEKENRASKPISFLFSTIQFIVSVFRDYLRLRIWAIVIPLLIVIFMGKLLTKEGLLVIVIILIYILLSYLDKWFEKHEEQ